MLATQTLVYRVAQTMRITIDGALPYGTSSKDVIIWVISRIGAQGARGYAVEFAGTTIASLVGRSAHDLVQHDRGSRRARRVDRAGPDHVRLRARARPSLDDAAWQAALEDWRDLKSDRDATLRRRIPLRRAATSRRSSRGARARIRRSPSMQPIPDAAAQATPEAAAALAPRARLHRTRIGPADRGHADRPRVYRLVHQWTDRRLAHRRGDRARASASPKACARWSCRARAACAAQAEAEGIAKTLIDAGFEWREPGCSMCLAMNDDVLEAGERCASTTNRNFEGRQGRGGRTHLMSPAMAAAAALTGMHHRCPHTGEHTHHDDDSRYHRRQRGAVAHREPRHRPDHAEAVPAHHRQGRVSTDGSAVRPAFRRARRATRGLRAQSERLSRTRAS